MKDYLLFIGDVHGEITQLESLLVSATSYDVEAQKWDLAEQIPVFLGDLIDTKKPSKNVNQLDTLKLVKGLMEPEPGVFDEPDDRAFCIMGNHELNAIGWAMRHPETDKPLREHSDKNRKQHQAFLDEVFEDSDTHKVWIDWFKKLPLFLDFGNVRAIHAYWHDDLVAKLKPYLNPDNSLREEHWVHAFDSRHELYNLLEVMLKGPEIKLPTGHQFTDLNGASRNEIRVKWWLEEAKTYRDVAISVPTAELNNIPEITLPNAEKNPVQSVPVFVGHYKQQVIEGDSKELLSDKVCCLDFYVGNKVDLTGYFFSGEQSLNAFSITGQSCTLAEHIESYAKIETAKKRMFELDNKIKARLSSYNYGISENYQASEIEFKLFDQINTILLEDWAPIPFDVPEDEYHSYAYDLMIEAIYGDRENMVEMFNLYEHSTLGLQDIESEMNENSNLKNYDFLIDKICNLSTIQDVRDELMN